MATDDGSVAATVYLQVRPVFSYYGDNVCGARVVNSTQSKPSVPKGGTVTVKLTLHIPRRAFLPLVPEAVVVVPEELTAAHRIEVVAEDPA
jgi:hypothetical protein